MIACLDEIKKRKDHVAAPAEKRIKSPLDA
jgi:hypothetical protein